MRRREARLKTRLFLGGAAAACIALPACAAILGIDDVTGPGGADATTDAGNADAPMTLADGASFFDAPFVTMDCPTCQSLAEEGGSAPDPCPFACDLVNPKGVASDDVASTIWWTIAGDSTNLGYVLYADSNLKSAVQTAVATNGAPWGIARAGLADAFVVTLHAGGAVVKIPVGGTSTAIALANAPTAVAVPPAFTTAGGYAFLAQGALDMTSAYESCMGGACSQIGSDTLAIGTAPFSDGNSNTYDYVVRIRSNGNVERLSFGSGAPAPLLVMSGQPKGTHIVAPRDADPIQIAWSVDVDGGGEVRNGAVLTDGNAATTYHVVWRGGRVGGLAFDTTPKAPHGLYVTDTDNGTIWKVAVDGSQANEDAGVQLVASGQDHPEAITVGKSGSDEYVFWVNPGDGGATGTIMRALAP